MKSPRPIFFGILAFVIIATFIIFSCIKEEFKREAKIATKKVTEVMSTTAKVTGEIVDKGEGIIDHGVFYSTSVNARTGTKVSKGIRTSTGEFIVDITGLTQATKYYTCVFSEVNGNFVYGTDLEFTTLGTPSLTTSAATNITTSSAKLSGTINNDRGAPVTDRGFYWRTAANQDTTGTRFQSGSGTGPFSADITNLSPNTFYYFKAYATNSVGTSYGARLSFTTHSLTVPGAPTIGTAIAGNAQATITFASPTDNGGSAIILYTAISNPGNLTGTGSTSPVTVTGLTNGTEYTFTVAATNALGTGPASSASNPVIPLVTDVDGNGYHIVTIDTQTWMAENLKTTKYNDGTDIPLVSDVAAWQALATPGYCWYNNDAAANKTVYGALYNWYTVNTGKLCPSGWHVPSDDEWTTLTNYLGDESVAGGKLKEAGIAHWVTPNTGATNESGFTALPGGYRSYDGTYDGVGYYGLWWSSTEHSTTSAWGRFVGYGGADVFSYNDGKRSGFSVRCLRDLGFIWLFDYLIIYHELVGFEKRILGTGYYNRTWSGTHFGDRACPIAT